MLFIKQLLTKKIEKILLFREQQQLIINNYSQKYNLPIITINLNIPGIAKNKKKYWCYFQKKFSLILNNLNYQYQIVLAEIIYTNINFSGIIVVNNTNSILIKNTLISYEEQDKNQLKLFDLDVYDNNLKKISRIKLNHKSRECFICFLPAKICARQQNHSINQLLKYVHNIINKEKNASGWRIRFK